MNNGRAFGISSTLADAFGGLKFSALPRVVGKLDASTQEPAAAKHGRFLHEHWSMSACVVATGDPVSSVAISPKSELEALSRLVMFACGYVSKSGCVSKSDIRKPSPYGLSTLLDRI